MHAELQSLARQLAEAKQEVISLQQQQAHGGSASVLPNSNPSTLPNVGAASLAQDSAAQETSTASADKESSKDKDTQLQVVPECMAVTAAAICIEPLTLPIA